MRVNASSIMTRHVATASPDDTIVTLARRLTDRRIGALPVCAQNGELLGIVSEMDLLRPLQKPEHDRRQWRLRILVADSDLGSEVLKSFREMHHRARDVMSTPVITARESTSIHELAEVMQRHSVKHLPIVENGRVVGIVSRADLVRALAEMPELIFDSD